MSVITRTAAIAVLGLFGTGLLAQPPRPNDLIDQAKGRQQIIDQKAEADVLKALQEADRLAKSNPARAAQALRAAQGNIDLAVEISGDTRKTLTALLQGKIAAIEGKPDPNAVAAKLDPNGATAKANQKAAFEAFQTEIKEVGDGIDAVKRLQGANKYAEADQVVAALNKKYPNNPAVIGLVQKDSVGKLLADDRAFRTTQAERITVAMRSVDKSSLPAIGDVEFPADWKDKAGKRKPLHEVELTAKEKKLIEALDKPITMSFNRPLDECLQELSNEMNQSLFIDAKSLADLGIDLKKPVQLDAKGISARTVLRQLLGAQGLTFVVKGEAIQVVDVVRARDMLVTRVYYLGDVVQGVGPFGGALRWGTFLDYQQTMANVQVVMDAIQSGIDPLSWKDKGGPGTVTFHFPSMSLIVRASSEVHASLGSKLGGK